ncbi:MAG: septum site-determining protein MinC [Lachnospiraceae bacterium]|nr:septum site-determining protein MinC [Lachnospiraceae bacterium]
MDAVTIKSFKGGINLILDQNADFEVILESLADKFRMGRNFFGNSNIAVSICGRELDNRQELEIIKTINDNSDVNVLCIVGQDEVTQKNFVKTVKQVEESLSHEATGRIFRGSVKNGDTIECKESIIILGDVYPGCSVVSDRNIIVYGGLYGKAYAGMNGNESCFVAALEMEPERITISEKVLKPAKPKFSILKNIKPQICSIKNGSVVTEVLYKDMIGEF